MITAHDEESLIDTIKGLSELEFAAILKQMAEHLRRNDWEHMIDECFDIETFEEEYNNANEEVALFKKKFHDADNLLNKIRELI